MNTESRLSESEEQIPQNGREAKGFRAFMKRPITLISTAAVVGAAVLGVVVLGDLSRTDTATATVASSRSTSSTGNGNAVAGGSPPSGAPGGSGSGGSGSAGAPGGSSTQTYTDTGTYTLSGGTASKSGTTFTASGTDQSGVLVEGGGVLTLTDVTLSTSGASKSSDESSFYGLDSGLLVYQSGKVTIDGDAFYVKNTKATVLLEGGAKISESSGKLIDAVDSGIVTFTAQGETLSGNIVTDNTSSATVLLEDSSSLTGMIDKAALTLDSSSKWIVTANSTVTTLKGAVISGDEVTNIVGNGHNVYYSKSSSANSYLGGKTYQLADGGELIAR